jgi:hypothetical protein
MSDPTASMEDEEQEQDERPLKPDLSAFARFDYDFEHVQHEQQLTFALVSSVLMSATSAGGADFPDGVQQIVNSYAATIDLVTIEIRGIPKTDAPNTILPPNTRDPANAANSPLNHKSDDIINILVPRAAFQWALPSEELLFPTLTEAVTRLHPAATKYELQLSMPTKPMPSIIKYVIHQCNSRSKYASLRPHFAISAHSCSFFSAQIISASPNRCDPKTFPTSCPMPGWPHGLVEWKSRNCMI